MIAGTVSTGRPSSTPNVSRFVAVSPVAVEPRGAPASTSIRYWSAPATAPPPGTMRPKALPASCEVAMSHQRARRIEIHSTAHSAAKLAGLEQQHQREPPPLDLARLRRRREDLDQPGRRGRRG